MKVQVNGKLRQFDDVQSLLDLVNALHVPTQGLIIQQNGDLFRESDFSSTRINDEDEIELIHFMGGG